MLEVERTWELGEGLALPDLEGSADGGTVTLVATYHDTADLRLARTRVTLRRRTGGKDPGWHLKLPAGRDREELQRPLGRVGTVPGDLTALVRSRTRGVPVVPVVELRTTRHLVVVTDAAGNRAEVADDRVTATRLGAAGPAAVTWREVEVELLGDSDPALLDRVGAVLAAAGARPSDWQSKLGRALATTGRGVPAGVPAAPGDVAAVLAYVSDQVEQITVQDPRVRLRQDDAVHAMRVATRRLRSTLGTFGELWSPAAIDGLADRLRGLAAQLGQVRDREVLLDRFTTRLLVLGGAGPAGAASGDSVRGDCAPGDSVPGGELAGLLTELLGGRSAAEVAGLLVPGRVAADRALLRSLDSAAHLDLLDRLVALTDPGTLAPAGASVDRTALFALADPGRRALARSLRRSHQGGYAVAEDLHRARRAAKRTRYAAEALVPLAGGRARRFVEAHKALAQVLGEHQDSVVARVALAAAVRGTATGPGAAGRPGAGARADPAGVGFAAGLLHRDEQERAAAALADLPALERAAGRRRLTRWMR